MTLPPIPTEDLHQHRARRFDESTRTMVAPFEEREREQVEHQQAAESFTQQSAQLVGGLEQERQSTQAAAFDEGTRTLLAPLAQQRQPAGDDPLDRAFGDLGPDVVERMKRIRQLESGGRADAHKNDEIEDSRGPLQINARAHPQLAAKYDLFDPDQNARAAREVYDAQGEKAWFNASQQLGPSAVQTMTKTGTPPVQTDQKQTGRVEAVGQFEQGLSDEEAYSICGPVAALAFAQQTGRNPSLAEARVMARKVGWTADGGMNGVANQKRLLDGMGVASRLDTDVDFGEITADAASGNPVIVSTAKHYYYVNGYDPETGKLHVGKTGTARKGGATWMSPQEIANLDGGINGALYVDNPGSPEPSVAVEVYDQPEMGSVANEDEDVLAEGRYLGPELGRKFQASDVQGTEAPRMPSLADIPAGVADAAGSVVNAGAQGILDVGAALGDAIRKLPGGDAAVELLQSHQKEQEYRRNQTPLERSLDPPPDPMEEQINIAMGISGGGLGKVGAVGAATAKAAAGRVLPAAARAIDEVAEIARLRLDKFPEAVRETIEQAAKDGEFWRTQRRGVIPDAQAEEMADALGLSVDKIIAKGQAGRSYNTEETRAIRNAYVAQAVKVNSLAAEIAAAPHKAGNEMLAEQLAEGAKLVDLSRIAEGARSEAGRALRAYQTMARDFAKDPVGATDRIVKAVGGHDEAVKVINEYNTLVQTGADAYQMANFWAMVEKPPPGVEDWFKLVRYNSMLSGPRTFEINAIGNVVEVPWRLARDTVSSLARGNAREIGPELVGAWHGLQKGVEGFLQTVSHGITAEQAARGEMPSSISSRVKNPLGKGTAVVLESVGRGLQGMDEFGHQLAYGMEIGRRAAITASREGLTRTAWDTRVAELMTTPTKSMMLNADAVAQRMTFKGEMGQLGSALGAVQKVPYLGNILLPFLRTVYHITARGIDRSPLGAFGTGADVLRGVYGPKTLKNLGEQLSGTAKELPKGVVPLGERVGDNIIGSAITVGFVGWAYQGAITGAGPDDPEKRDMLRAQGWRPYSLKLGDAYYSYSNWGPIAVSLAAAAGVAESGMYAKPDAGVAARWLDAARRASEMLTDQSYLQGIGAIDKARKDPERYGYQWLMQFLQTLVPFGSAINTAGQITDPLARQPEKGNAKQALAARFPGLREDVPTMLDQMGRDVENEQSGANAFNPIRRSQERPDPVLTALLDARVDIGEPPKELSNIPLTEQERRFYQREAGDLIRVEVERAMDSPKYASGEQTDRADILRAAVSKARRKASEDFLRGIPVSERKERATVGAGR